MTTPVTRGEAAQVSLSADKVCVCLRQWSVLHLAREPSDERTGVFTSGIVSTQQGRRIALYFTGRQHAGENLRDVLEHRIAELGRPIQMCDALSRNTPKLSDGAEILLANCLAHGRRQFVEVAANFPRSEERRVGK